MNAWMAIVSPGVSIAVVSSFSGLDSFGSFVRSISKSASAMPFSDDSESDLSSASECRVGFSSASPIVGDGGWALGYSVRPRTDVLSSLGTAATGNLLVDGDHAPGDSVCSLSKT